MMWWKNNKKIKYIVYLNNIITTYNYIKEFNNKINILLNQYNNINNAANITNRKNNINSINDHIYCIISVVNCIIWLD